MALSDKTYLSNAYSGAYEAMSQSLDAAIRSNATTRTMHALVDKSKNIRKDSIRSIDPISSSVNKQRLHYASIILNYANVPYADYLAEASVRSWDAYNEKSSSKESFQKMVNAAIPYDQINLIALEIQDRIEAVENLIANIDVAISTGVQDMVVENKVEQARVDIKLITDNLTVITDLIDKISSSLPKAADSTNIKQVIDVLLNALDILSQFIMYVDIVTDQMTPEEYERVVALAEELGLAKDKVDGEPADVTKILQNVVVAAMDMIRPYITNLALMLAFECFNAIMKVIKKIPGAGGAFPPPIDMIPHIITLVGMVVSGNIDALIKRLGSDIHVIFTFIKSSVVVSISSDAAVTAAEERLAIKEAESKTEIDNDATAKQTDAALNALRTNNQSIVSYVDGVQGSLETTAINNSVTRTVERNTAALQAKRDEEEDAVSVAKIASDAGLASKHKTIQTLIKQHE